MACLFCPESDCTDRHPCAGRMLAALGRESATAHADRVITEATAGIERATTDGLAKMGAVLAKAKAPRKPCSGWRLTPEGRWVLVAGPYRAEVWIVTPTGDPRDLECGPPKWEVRDASDRDRLVADADRADLLPRKTIRAAMLDAEGVLEDVAHGILKALGRAS